LTATNIGAVPSGRQVIAGTGLSGGGDLSADRTLTVLYGTTTGTAASGDRGLPTGGTTTQVLVKNSATDYDTGWTSFIEDRPLDPAAQFVAPNVRWNSIGTLTLTANLLWYQALVVEAPMVIDGLMTQVSTGAASSEIRLGLYAADEDWQPVGAPIVDAGKIDSSTTGYKTASFSAITIGRGRYVSAHVSNGTPTVRRAAGVVTGAFGTGSATLTNVQTVSLQITGQSSVFTNGFPNPPVAWTEAGITTGFPWYTVFLRVA
jgi:hypothetical protein